ncbi:MAG: hypothetical protein V7K27_21825 [Nostoc sp.]|uniref:hypothetical protein n=1 Tax=Nostoc sp. TaxID=1180 RepID=UPI002FF76349
MKAIALISLRILVGILIALAILPVALLPISTSVPVSLLILFAMAEVALFVAVFRLGFTVRVMLAELAGFFAIALLAIFASQLFASTPPILDTNGKPIPNSIAVLEKVNLGGAEEWITIRGKDSHNPGLLFLAGGPGGSQLVTERSALAGLDDHFVVVNWEQPGAGKSFDAVDRSKLTLDRYIQFELSVKPSKQDKEAQGKSGFVPVAARWVIERSNAWMERCKILVKNFERTLVNTTAKLNLCFIRLMLKRLAAAS